MTRIDRLPGTRDFYPPEMRVRRWIEERWREVARRYGFEEYDGPVLEPLELYTQKAGEEIVRQLYTFTDRGEREVALRPDMTPSLARMVAARSQGLPKPVKWFSVPRLFRYERPQRGRFREFWQLNLDIVGIEGIEADAEIMAAGTDVLRACGLTAGDFAVRYSDRRLLDAVLGGLGIDSERRPAAYAALDRLLRADAGEVVTELERGGVTRATAGVLVEAIGQRDLAGLAAALEGRGVALEPELERLGQLADSLEAYGVGEFCAFDAGIVRGLAYYTGVVFEMHDRTGALRALCGGGRFDRLLAAVGGEDLPAVGFGLGEAVLWELLAERGRLPAAARELDAFVIPLAPGDRRAAIEVATRLRAAGLACDLPLRDQAPGKALKAAAQAGARFAVLIGPREREAGSARIKDLASGTEVDVPIEALPGRLRQGAGA